MSSTLNVDFTRGPMGTLYAKTAIPIIFVMVLNGLVAVADAMFLGWYVGADALAAVTAVFPAYMMIIALSVLVSSGMASLLARGLGGGKKTEAEQVFTSAHGLAIFISFVLIAGFYMFGDFAVAFVISGNGHIAEQAHLYLGINVYFMPILFFLSVNSDALRNEGRLGLMAGGSLAVSLLNIGFNYIFIVEMGWGVAGSAYGTVTAQIFALCLILFFRMKDEQLISSAVLFRNKLVVGWKAIIGLGLPQSLNFMGMALVSAVILFALQGIPSDTYTATVSAYGIITRVMTFVFFPLLGLAQAMQTIVGTNYGARNWERSDRGLKAALIIAGLYGVSIQILFTFFPAEIGEIFVSEASVIAEVSRVLPIMVSAFFISGPLMMIAMYFQAIGKAGKAAVLGISKPYLFTVPLLFIAVNVWGAKRLWYALPMGEVALLVLTMGVLFLSNRKHHMKFGVFQHF